MSSVEPISVGDSVNMYTKIGESGRSGATDVSYPEHLHMDFRGASSTYTNDTTYRYPLNWFYSSVSNSNDMSFINRTQADTNTVKFRCRSIYSGGAEAKPKSVVFHYKADGGTWATAPSNLITTSDGITFTINISSLYTNYMYYYFEAATDSWEKDVNREAYRPYRNKQAPPEERPFYVSKTRALNSLDACIAIENEINEKVPYDIELEGTIKTIKSDKEIIVIGKDDNKEYTLKFKTKHHLLDEWKEGWVLEFNGFTDDIYIKNSIDIKEPRDIKIKPGIVVNGIVKSIISEKELILIDKNREKEYKINFINGFAPEYINEGHKLCISGFYDNEIKIIETNEYLVRNYSTDIAH